MNDKEKKRRIILTVIAGIWCGILCALFVLTGVTPANFQLFDGMMFIGMIFAAVFPFCLYSLKKFGFMVAQAAVITPLVSLVLCLLYALVVGGDPASVLRLAAYFGLIHAPGILIGALVMIGLVYRHKKR